MPKFVIAGEIAGVGNLGGAELHGIAVRSCAVLQELPQVQWLHSYVTDDRIYCVYIAPDAGPSANMQSVAGSRPTASARSATSSIRRLLSERAS
jgi:hypothetical protein